MSVWSRRTLSGSTNGRAITITTSEPGTTIHAVSTATNVRDTIYLWAQSIATDGLMREITLNWGGTGSRDQIYSQIPGRDGLYAVVPGLSLDGGTSTGSGIAVYALGTATGQIQLFGYVDRAS